MRFVPLTRESQLDLQTLHRARQRLVGNRTRLTNQLPAVLFESGIIIPKRRAALRLRLDAVTSEGLPLGERSGCLIADDRSLRRGTG